MLVIIMKGIISGKHSSLLCQRKNTSVEVFYRVGQLLKRLKGQIQFEVHEI